MPFRGIAKVTFFFLLFCSGAAFAADEAGVVAYEKTSSGTREFIAGELVIKVLVEARNLGSSEVEVGEIVFPAGYESRSHNHGAIEIFYVVSGTLLHEVNGETHTLTPGMVGIVRPADTVTHRVGADGPARTVVIWAPGGEAERLAGVFPEQRKLD